ncbi:hypothetical protein B7P43_G14079 [Cryptotermes secundus]|uniref:Group XIIA secretory phospholipase A2 n=1 Tax=Cryptotermes secundus TaxID=105785 RepID=A0A2J7PMR6_9NEOP|nr:hypothetical protein B7P43_G14079 [Cryptotermes secundus]
MVTCCNDHDICYDTCGEKKELCDFEFKKCLYTACRRNDIVSGLTGGKGCKVVAKLSFTATMTLGCKSYLDSQEEACTCIPRKKKYTRGGKSGEL